MVRTIIAVAVGGFLGAIVYATMADMSGHGTPRLVSVELTMNSLIIAGAIIVLACSLFFSLANEPLRESPRRPKVTYRPFEARRADGA